MDTIPPASPDNQTPACACKKGGKICIAASISAILAIIVSLIDTNIFIGSNIFFGAILTLVALILSIIAIFKGFKPFGITMLILSVLIVGPTSCGLGIWKNKGVQERFSTFQKKMEKNAPLIKEIEAAKEAGDMEKAAKLQKELLDNVINDGKKARQTDEG